MTQSTLPSKRYFLFRSDFLPAGDRFRAAVVNEHVSAIDIFCQAQHGEVCGREHFSCYVDLPPQGRRFFEFQAPPVETGMLLHGGVMMVHSDATSPTTAPSDDEPMGT